MLSWRLKKATFTPAWKLIRLKLRGLLFGFFALDRVVNLSAVDTYALGRCYPKSHLVAADVHDLYLNVVADHDRFVLLPA